MPGHVSATDDLVLHGPRVLGFASSGRIAARFGLDPDEVHELLLDYEACGWMQHSTFANSSGWSLTDAGRAENERRLSLELDKVGGREVVRQAHADFLPLNRRFATACTNWQVRPTHMDPMAANDHTDWAWDERVFRTLDSLDRALHSVGDPLAATLQRFDGYADRYSSARAKVDAGQRRFVDAPDIDSCHTVWIQLHEDLLASLGIPRGTDD